MRNWKRVAVAAAAFGLVGSAWAADSGKDLYDKNCKRCHAEDGTGMKDGKPLPMVKALKVEEHPELLNVVRADSPAKGKAEIVTAIVKGKEKMKAMPQVTPDQAAVIADYVLTLRGTGK